MKILYAIQGTGNGHLARAEDIIPILKQYGDLDLFVSGAQADIKLAYPVKYKSKGLSFYFGKSGGIDFVKTFRHNSSKEVYKEIKKFPVEKYDLVINDFEPVTAWACRKRDIPCVGLSHQSSLLSPKVPKPKKIDPVGEWVLHNYAPVDSYVSFHFNRYDKNMFTPVIREAVRKAKNETKDHYTVYLPSYDDKKLVPLLAKINNVRWHIFSKHAKKPYHVGKLSVYPVNKDEFAASMTSSRGVLCGAGFETPAEALYLGKKLLVVPMKSQLEQHYNAASLKQLGVPVLKKMKKKSIEKIIEWIDTDAHVSVDYKDITAEAVEMAVAMGTRKIGKQ
ncbi:glycosyltransferase family protein [Chryseolinea lacunae]|uniref:Glycosyl transferase n=1 Tax=Chryseolinea lacunae TaxID=2801331 RepID=A0ABS1L1C5_9BACT|nr:glycosyl transferase [Chryseolinea lacunae]